MARVAPVVPDQSTLLCEGCGYMLTGLAEDSRCPECGKLIAESLPNIRQPTTWEQSQLPVCRRFWATTAELIFHPSRFYRGMRTRPGHRLSKSFAAIHRYLASLFFGLSALIQALWLYYGGNIFGLAHEAFVEASHGLNFGLGISLCALLSIALSCFFMDVATSLAARLSAWEAAYRGMRLPHQVVVRGLQYHSAHYLPVALLAFTTVAGYQILLATHVLTELSAPRYLYILCAEVILSAGYLFSTYWKGMRNMMFANS